MLANGFTKKVLYQLKKWHGRNIDLYLRGAVSQNVETGVQTYPESKWKIKRAPVMEIESIEGETKAQNFAVAGRPFEFGGIFNLYKTVVIVENKDLPRGYILNKYDNFVLDHKRFQIINTKALQENRVT